MAGYSGSEADVTSGILADALRASEQEDVERWLSARNPMLSSGDFGMFPVGLRADVGPAGGAADGSSSGLRKALRLPERLPGVWLPAAADLASAARGVQLTGLLAGLASWVGAGRPVGRGNELAAADAAEAARWLGVVPDTFLLLWQNALAASWVEVLAPAGGRGEGRGGDGRGGGRSQAVAGTTATDWAAAGDALVLHAWTALFAAVLAGTLDVAASWDPAGPGTLSFQGQGSLAALRLFLARGEGGLPAGDIRDLILNGAAGEMATSRVRRHLDTRARTHADPVRVLIDQLAALGAVEPSPIEDRIRLTPLALRALRGELTAAGVAVPLVSGYTEDLTAADLVALHGGLLAAEHARGTGHWIAARGPRQAAAEMLAFAAGADAASRLVAVGIVRAMGESAAPAWRDGLKRPELRPYARIELSRLASVMAESTMPLVLEPSPDDVTWLATDLLALACGEDDPDPDLIAAQFREAVPAGEEEWIFSLMSMSSHPDVVQVLTVLGRHHPDRRVARDARKAAHRAAAHRASGGRAASGVTPPARARH